MIRLFKLRPCCVAGAVFAVAAACAMGEPAPDVKVRMRQVSAAEFQAHVQSLQALVQACGEDAASCDAAKVGDDDRVDALHFQMHWGWLRGALTALHDAKPAEREALLKSAGERLDEIARENAQPADADTAKEFAAARADANKILDGEEFSDVEQQSWWQREVAKFWLWVGRVLGGMAVLGDIAPWFGRLLEVLLFGGAAVGLTLFVRRALQRQRLAVSLNTHAGELAWARDSTDWAARAEGSARDGDWRDAIHSLYWATIVMLEGRRAWRHNPARTPREYVRLLKPGSAQQRALRGLTQIFERLWYGLREAGPSDYERARALYESLRDTAAGAA